MKTKTETDAEMEAAEMEVEKEAEETIKTTMTELLHWNKVVALVQVAFPEECMAKDSKWQAVVLIPKGGGDYHSICLVEVMWKVVKLILNRRFTASIAFHDGLHGFWAGCSTGTASFEAKLIHPLIAMKEEVLYMIFLDLHKSYDALGRKRFLDILEGYIVVP